MITATHIIMHHSLTKDGDTVSWTAIRRYHTKINHWNDIGYHWGIEYINGTYEVLMGRSCVMEGAHCRQGGMNRTSIGICLVGNFDLEPPPDKQWRRAVKLVKWLKSIYHIPAANVQGHREYAPYKTCPGKLFDMDKFREDIS